MRKLSIGAAAIAALGIAGLSQPASAAILNGNPAAELQKAAGPGDALQRVRTVYRTVYVYRHVFRPYRAYRPYVIARPAYYAYPTYPSVGIGVGGVGLGYGGYALAYPTGYYGAPYYAAYPYYQTGYLLP
jgi:hypothetical protein